MRPSEDNYKVRYERLLGQRDDLRAQLAAKDVQIQKMHDAGLGVDYCDTQYRELAQQLAAANEARAKAERYGKMRDKTISEILVERGSAHAMLNDELNDANWRADTALGALAAAQADRDEARIELESRKKSNIQMIDKYVSDGNALRDEIARLKEEQVCEIALLLAERKDLRAQLAAIEEREAACCPEDVPFDCYVRTLQKQLAAATERAADTAQELEAAYSSLRDATDERDRLAERVTELEGVIEKAHGEVALAPKETPEVPRISMTREEMDAFLDENHKRIAAWPNSMVQEGDEP